VETSKLLGMRSFISAKCIVFILIGGFIIPSSAETKEIKIYLNEISIMPQAINADFSDRITWINNDSVPHEIYFLRNPMNSSDQHLRYQLRSAQSVSIIVTRAGDYDYDCRWQGMWGSIRVDQKSQR
jgi:plastocyanin